MKRPDVYLKEYCYSLSEDNLKFLSQRLHYRLQDDLAEALNFLCNVREIDRWLVSAETCDELFDMLDLVQDCIMLENGRRNRNE